MTAEPETAPAVSRTSLLRATAVAVIPSVLVPIAAYLTLARAGIPELWALVASAAVSVIVVAIHALRTGVVSTLGAIVLARFIAGVVVALVTGDARLTLAKDPAFTLLVAVGAVATLWLKRPLTIRIRRELSPDPSCVDTLWDQDASYRHTHHLLTRLWAAGLIVESLLGFLIVATVPITTAVLLTRVLGPVVLLTLSAWTVHVDSRATRAHPPSDPTAADTDR